MTYAKGSPQAARDRRIARERAIEADPTLTPTEKAIQIAREHEREARALAKLTEAPLMTPRTRAHPNSVHAKRLYEIAVAKKLLCISCNARPVQGQIAVIGTKNRRPWMRCIVCDQRKKSESWSAKLRTAGLK